MRIKPIRTKKDHERALKRIDDLWGCKKNSPEGDEFEILLTLTEKYEDEHYPIPPPDPEPPRPEPPPAPAVNFRSTMNASSAEFAASTDLQSDFSLRFLPKADWGQQHITLTGGFIAAESEEL